MRALPGILSSQSLLGALTIWAAQPRAYRDSGLPRALRAWAALTGASSQPPSTPRHQTLQALRDRAILVCSGRWDGTAESLFRSRVAFSPVGPVSPPWSPVLAIPEGCWIYQGLARTPPNPTQGHVACSGKRPSRRTHFSLPFHLNLLEAPGCLHLSPLLETAEQDQLVNCL